jgi:hypothetical protein
MVTLWGEIISASLVGETGGPAGDQVPVVAHASDIVLVSVCEKIAVGAISSKKAMHVLCIKAILNLTPCFLPLLVPVILIILKLNTLNSFSFFEGVRFSENHPKNFR